MHFKTLSFVIFSVLLTFTLPLMAQQKVQYMPRQETKYTAQQGPYPNDGDHATLVTLPGLRGVRYMEFMLVGSVPMDAQFMGTAYNTNPYREVGGKDSAPQAIADNLNPAELAKQNTVAKVWLNPPRQWLLDNIDIETGKVRDISHCNEEGAQCGQNG